LTDIPLVSVVDAPALAAVSEGAPVGAELLGGEAGGAALGEVEVGGVEAGGWAVWGAASVVGVEVGGGAAAEGLLAAVEEVDCARPGPATARAAARATYEMVFCIGVSRL
jgi:hypothetical protein